MNIKDLYPFTLLLFLLTAWTLVALTNPGSNLNFSQTRNLKGGIYEFFN
jgi:hypothetical protein